MNLILDYVWFKDLVVGSVAAVGIIIITQIWLPEEERAPLLGTPDYWAALQLYSGDNLYYEPLFQANSCYEHSRKLALINKIDLHAFNFSPGSVGMACYHCDHIMICLPSILTLHSGNSWNLILLTQLYFFWCVKYFQHIYSAEITRFLPAPRHIDPIW